MTLNEFFDKHSKVAIAFSGGVDSTYLLKAAVDAGIDVTAYYVKAAFQPQFEFDDALRAAKEIGADIKILRADILSCAEVIANPSNRCYFCKQQVFGTILKAA